MTPKEKAQQLYDKYLDCSGFYQTKECCILAVDEILNQDVKAFDKTEIGYHFEYWSNVKTEIEKL